MRTTETKKIMQEFLGCPWPTMHFRKCFWWLSSELGKCLTRQVQQAWWDKCYQRYPQLVTFEFLLSKSKHKIMLSIRWKLFLREQKHIIVKKNTHTRGRGRPNTKGRCCVSIYQYHGKFLNIIFRLYVTSTDSSLSYGSSILWSLFFSNYNDTC